MLDSLRRYGRRIVSAASALVLASACTSIEPASVSEIAAPDAAPTRAATRFDEALRCMDSQFADYGVSNVTIAVSTVPDHTGRAYVASDIWLPNAIARMTQRSKAFVVTDYNPNPYAPEQALHALMQNNPGFYVPAYYIRGSISGFAENVAAKSATGSVGGVSGDVGAGAARGYSVVSVNLHLGELARRIIVGRAQSANEVALESRSAGAQLGARLSKLGGNFEFTVSRSEGVPQAVNALIELGAIETLGRLTGTPYWTCLGVAQDAPEADQARRDIHANMSAPERVVFIQRRLGRMGLYQGPLDGVATPALATAIAAYAAPRGLGASTADSFALYARMTDWRADPVAPPAAPAPAAILPAAGAAAPPKAPAIALNLVAPPSPARPGAPVRYALSASQGVFVQCYLEDAKGAVARVFPNRWQSNPLVMPEAAVDLPSPRAGFDIVLPAEGETERLTCFGATSDIGPRLPDNLKVDDLTPVPGASLDTIRQTFQALAGGAAAVTTTSQTLKAGQTQK